MRIISRSIRTERWSAHETDEVHYVTVDVDGVLYSFKNPLSPLTEKEIEWRVAKCKRELNLKY